MPKTYSRNAELHFLPGETGISGTVPPSQVRMQKIAYGQARAPGDILKNPVRAYSGWYATGSVVRKNTNPDSRSYQPTPSDGGFAPWVGIGGSLNGMFPTLLNRAYSKFIDKVHTDQSQLVTTLAESYHELPTAFGNLAATVRGAADNVSRKAGVMARAYRHLRKGDLRRCLRALGLQPMAKHRSLLFHSGETSAAIARKSRKVALLSADLWLSYWFGWAPLADDVAHSVTILCSNTLPDGSVKLRGSAKERIDSTRTLGSGGVYTRVLSVFGQATGYVGATVKVINPNFARNTQLGINNPLGTLWELVPFSFVVDWFTNVGQVLASYSDLWGFDITDSYHGVFIKGKLDGRYGDPRVSQCRVTWSFRRLQRYIGIYKPVLKTPKFLNFGSSLTRAATAVSLLVALFLGK